MAGVGGAVVWKCIDDGREQNTPPLDWTGLVLTGLGMAGAVYGFHNLGRGPLPPWAIAVTMGGGAAMLALFAWHESRTRNAILHLSLPRIQTFSASLVGGRCRRFGLGPAARHWALRAE